MKLAHWTSLIREANTSGKKITVWCDENQISKRKYYYWHKKVMHSTYNALIEHGFKPPAELPDTSLSSVSVSAPVFAELKPPTQSGPGQSGPDIILEAGNIRVCVKDGFSEDSLRKVLRVISYAE